MSIINIISDIKFKKVYSINLIITSMLGLTSWYLYNKILLINCLIGYFLISMIFLIIFFISRQGIGLGDLFYLAFFASLYGYFFSILAFLFSFWIATLILIIPYFLKRINLKTKISFVPFMFTGCLIALCIGMMTKFYNFR